MDIEKYIRARKEKEAFEKIKNTRKDPTMKWKHPEYFFEQRCPLHGIHLIDGCECPLCKKDYGERELLKCEMAKKYKKSPILKKIPNRYPVRI